MVKCELTHPTGEEFSDVIRSAIEEIPKSLTNITTLRVHFYEDQKWRGNEKWDGYYTPSGYNWDWYLECIHYLFPGEIPEAPSWQEPDGEYPPAAVPEDALPLGPVFPKIKSLVL